MESVRSDVEVLTSSIYGDLGDDPVVSMYGYPGLPTFKYTMIILYNVTATDSVMVEVLETNKKNILLHRDFIYIRA